MASMGVTASIMKTLSATRSKIFMAGENMAVVLQFNIAAVQQVCRTALRPDAVSQYGIID
jgi:hypothetical protein